MSDNREIKLYILIFMFISISFLNLSFIDEKFKYFSLILGCLLIVLISYSNFILRRYFSKGDKYILIFSNLLSVIGIIMLFRLNNILAIKQVIWLTFGIAIFIMFTVIVTEINNLNKHRYIYLGITIILMSLGTFFGIEKFGAKNWIEIFGMSFQPSELGKIFLVVYLSSALQNYHDEKFNPTFLEKKFVNLPVKESIKKLIEPAIVVMISLGFMVLQRDLGSALIIFAISVVMLYIATGKTKYILTCLGLFSVGSILSYKMFYHVRRRIIIWRNPWKYAYNESYQVVQGLIAICSGGFFGTGLGLGSPTSIPVVTTDFIYAAICEEMGVLMGVAILILYFILFYRCMRVAIKIENIFSRLIVIGLSTMLASQALVIVGGVLTIIPLTGITLPFISYGGSSMIITHLAIGIIQKVSEEVE